MPESDWALVSWAEDGHQLHCISFCNGVVKEKIFTAEEQDAVFSQLFFADKEATEEDQDWNCRFAPET